MKDHRHRSLGSRLFVFLLLSILAHLFLFFLFIPHPMQPSKFHPVSLSLSSSQLKPPPILFRSTLPTSLEKLPAESMNLEVALDPTSPSAHSILPDIGPVEAPQLKQKTPHHALSPKTLILKQDLVDFDSLALNTLRVEIAIRETYEELYLFDADTTDSASKNTSLARQIVERAIRTMGGMEIFTGIKEMRTVVYILAGEDIVKASPPVEIQVNPPYGYPIEIWTHTSEETRIEPFPIKLDLSDPNKQLPPYMWRNPLKSIRIYRLLYKQGFPHKRWHFVDRFLGDGVQIDYVDTRELKGETVDVISVFDTRHNEYFEAYFSRSTHLLVATREGLVPRPKHDSKTPICTTYLEEYREVAGVLTPYQYHRVLRSPNRLTSIHNVVYNNN